MAFPQATQPTITGFEDISINLFVPGVNNTEGEQAGVISVQLTLSDGKIRVVDYDLLARLQDDAPGQAHLANLVSLRDYILARIDNEVVP